MKRATPIRLCVGCGKRDAQSRLLRFVAGPEESLVSGRGTGRGGYVHPQQKCVRAFVAMRNGFVRSLKATFAREARAAYAAQLARTVGLSEG